MMSQPIGIRILKRFAPMTGRGVKIQSASRRQQKLSKLGEHKTKEEIVHIYPYLEPSVMAVYFGYPVLDVEKKNPSLITKITTSLLRLCGFANPATNNVTKN